MPEKGAFLKTDTFARCFNFSSFITYGQWSVTINEKLIGKQKAQKKKSSAQTICLIIVLNGVPLHNV